MPDAVSTGLPRPTGVQPCRLDALAAAVSGRLYGPATAQLAVTGVSAASDRVRPGDLFAAVPGASVHGARFAADALAAGAVAVLTDPSGRGQLPEDAAVLEVDQVRAALGPISAEVYGRPSSILDIVGVTGTSGKTTTAYLLRAGLTAAGRRTGLIGTVATLVGEQRLTTGFTTPEAPELQALLAVMAERGVTSVAMEVSSHALGMHRADGIAFAVAGFTNLSQDHLDFHTDMDDYFAAKARLFDGRSRRTVIVVDDEWGVRMAEVATRAAALQPRTAEPVTVSAQDHPADWTASDITDRADGTTSFRVRGPGIELATGCAIPGRFNVANVLLALAMLHAVGVDVVVAAPAVARATVPGRMQRVEAGQPFLAVVDYSHKPAAVEGALAALRTLTRGRLIIVLGCGGDRDRAKRPLMGQVAATGADLLVVTDDNPRSEDPAAIRRAMLAGARNAPGRGEVIEVGDRRAAIDTAVAAATAGDIVLVAGKGHETGQEIGGAVLPFDDVQQLRAAIEAAAR